MLLERIKKQREQADGNSPTKAHTPKDQAGDRKRIRMSQLVTPYGTFNLIQYETEQEFERAIVAHVNDIFGERRIYLDCKRRIGTKDGRQSVPDAYLST